MHSYPATIFQRLVLVITLSGLLTGCSSFNCTKLGGVLGTEQNLITLATQITDNLTQKAFPPLLPGEPELPILVTTFVNNDNLKETSRFGRILQEHIASRLVQTNYTVKEIKLRQTLLMQEQSGETMLSRDTQKIDPKQSLTSQAILVGTYSYTDRVMYISARLVNPKDRNIISSYDYQLCMDDNISTMFEPKRKPSTPDDEVAPPKKSVIDSIFY